MHDGSTKMVSVAHALSEALGADAKKYEKAMAKRLEQESQDSLPFETLDLRDGEFPYILKNNEGTVYVGTQDNFDWLVCHGEFPEKISEDMALHYHQEKSWPLVHDAPIHPDLINDIRAQMESRRKFLMDKEMLDLEEDDSWDDWDDEEEDVPPLRREERKDRKQREKERTIQRRKQRERKIIYRSDDAEVPVYGYDEDWK
ncbi:MAG: hypothetical protein ACWGQW_01575 [bacterium]